jgi:hypothetical protein
MIKFKDGHVEYVGATISSDYIQIMSDVWARGHVVWTGTGIKNVITDYENPDVVEATIDATPETLRAVHAYWTARQIAGVVAGIEGEWYKAASKAAAVQRGDEVRVVKGRKVPVGTVGTAGWVGESSFGYRVGIDLPDGTRTYTALDNVVSLDAPDRIPPFPVLDQDDIEGTAAVLAARFVPGFDKVLSN